MGGENFMGSLLQSFTKIAASILIVYCAFMALLYFSQEKFLFFPQTVSSSKIKQIEMKYKNAEEIALKTPDNVYIKGWFVKNGTAKRTPLVIYFGGNGDELSNMIKESQNFGNWSLVLINYRGYGKSEGKPGEKEFYSDALTIYDYFSERPDVDGSNIIVFGRSIGTGVAVYLANKRPLKGVILVSPYDNIISLAEREFPYVPVGLILKHRFDSISEASSIKIPLLVLTADADKTVPQEYSQKLAAKWGGPHGIVMIKGKGHNDINSSPLYWQSVNDFLGRMILSGPAGQTVHKNVKK